MAENTIKQNPVNYCTVIQGKRPVLNQAGQLYYQVAIHNNGDQKICYWRCKSWHKTQCKAVTRTTVTDGKHIELHDGTNRTMKVHNHSYTDYSCDMYHILEHPSGNVYVPPPSLWL